MAPLRSLLLLSLVTTLAALNHAVAASSNNAQAPLLIDDDDDDYVCTHPPYKVLMVSKSPLVIYINDFITPEERAHLQRITKDTFSHSAVTSRGSVSGRQLHSVRTSQSTSVSPDAVVRCIEDRALSFQGYDVPRSHLEPLQLVKYAVSQRYNFHTDWFTDPAHSTSQVGGNRVSSFFAYVHVANDTTGGGTNFPLLDSPSDERWCDLGIVDCDEQYENGVTFLPREGNAIYWENLLPDGRGDERTLHAGLPVTSGGGKIGMNIWTRQLPLGKDIRGEAD
ncbi:hypothetical protein QBC46DRAFT_344184 [Diplogelasinospora grovesii]|uniref:Prolyl 4-hydroxylase alpha subunit domain-containing protein n=1 Tax=Diplogelasinospora grovesii TaxID=303347 RepID=A0AAN6N5L3_9PEZI|nr:hypothetical protein QBC46DRAFT_344184 [Diplogelasinospora grovesii]